MFILINFHGSRVPTRIFLNQVCAWFLNIAFVRTSVCVCLCVCLPPGYLKPHFITKVLEYKAGLKGGIKFVCIAMCSLVMSLCSHDLHVTSLNNNYYNTLNSSSSTYTAPGFWMVQHQLVTVQRETFTKGNFDESSL